jgi:hypothetical protein
MGALMKRTIHPVAEKQSCNGSFKGYALAGWEYEEGWLISSSSIGHDSATTIWVDGTSDLPCFYSIHRIQLDGQRAIEIDPEPIEVSQEEKDAILSAIWEWEIWEPVTRAGTCVIDSLVRMLDLSRDVVLDWFRTTLRNPSIQENIVKTLEENGYTVDIAGPEGFGKFHEYRRLVTMFRKDDPNDGHVVLIYENDSAIFDASGVFKRVADILWSDSLGYNRGPVLKVEKKQG